MKYRILGKTGEKVSVLGYGCMRFPLILGREDDAKNIDVPEAIRLIRHAIDSGVNYIDTAYYYHGSESEKVVGLALRDGYREKAFIATKSPVYAFQKEEDFFNVLDEQLHRLQTDRIDFYLLHALNRETWEKVVLRFGILDKLRQAKEEGKIRHIGFSFHDDVQTFKDIVDYTDIWEFCQIQINYLDVSVQAGLEGLRYAAEKGLGVISMEPLKGGFLANLPDNAKTVLHESGENRSQVDWALSFLWDMPEISLLLSGMSSFEQLEENLNLASKSSVGMLSDRQKKTIAGVQEILSKDSVVPCTGCGYCSECPKKIAIPHIFSAYKKYQIYGDLNGAREMYDEVLAKFSPVRGSECIGCRTCEKICPQQIKISEWMPKIDGKLGESAENV